MQIIEQFICGKSGDDHLCEDKIHVTPDFIAVLDGATSRQGLTLNGWSNGRFAAEILAAGIDALSPDATAADAVITLTHLLRNAAESAARKEGKSFPELWARPAAAALLYSRARQEVWRVADSSFMIDGKVNYRTFPQEEIWANLRHAFLVAQMARGATEDDLIDNDPSWELLTPLISEFKIFANYAGEFGYGVFNGTEIPPMHIEVFPAANAKEIVFASDGYPKIFPTLKETEDDLARILAADPLMHKIHPQVKGRKKGQLSFDDRCYIRFKP